MRVESGGFKAKISLVGQNGLSSFKVRQVLVDGAEVPAVQLATENDESAENNENNERENANGAAFQIQTPPLARLYSANHKIRVLLENADAGPNESRNFYGKSKNHAAISKMISDTGADSAPVSRYAQRQAPSPPAAVAHITELSLVPGAPEVKICVNRGFCKNVRFPDDARSSLEERLAGMNALERFYALEREFRLNSYCDGISSSGAPDSSDILFELLPHGLLCIDADFPDLNLDAGAVSRSSVRLRSAEGQEVVLELLVSMANGQVALDQVGELLTRRIAVPVDLRSDACLECVRARRLPAERVLPLKKTFLLSRASEAQKDFHLELSLAGLDFERLKFIFVPYAPHLALGYLGEEYQASVPQQAFSLQNASATSEALKADVVFDLDAFLEENEKENTTGREGFRSCAGL